MITVEKFLQCVQENAARVTHYQSGGDGSGDGGCDCIGLIIGALRLAGEKWTGTHGTNWTVRNAIQEPWAYKLTKESELQPGMIVFKMRDKSDPNYSLPDSYKDSGDSRDFYHVGVVMRVNPLTILHCTGVEGGIARDEAVGSWAFYNHLKGVQYPGQTADEEILYYARVYAANGKPVRMRPEPSTDKDEICKVPINMVVGVLEHSTKGWFKILYSGMVGYMMSEFLVPLNDDQRTDYVPDETEDTAPEPDTDHKPEGLGEYVSVNRSLLEDAYHNLKNAEAAIRYMLGVE